ncbi:MAG: hypothetical protein ABR536_04470, partial [Solirubrobacterales bacterium]
MVLAWVGALVAAIVIFSTGIASKFQADYSTPGSESKRASSLIEQKFGGFSGDTIDVVWKSDTGQAASG